MSESIVANEELKKERDQQLIFYQELLNVSTFYAKWKKDTSFMFKVSGLGILMTSFFLKIINRFQ